MFKPGALECSPPMLNKIKHHCIFFFQTDENVPVKSRRAFTKANQMGMSVGEQKTRIVDLMETSH
ncbi:hypothetical protein T06_16184 [Trichinella sp. T6]|nr:hypothetical protein T06_16184 [Trichinella sp. T6]